MTANDDIRDITSEVRRLVGVAQAEPVSAAMTKAAILTALDRIRGANLGPVVDYMAEIDGLLVDAPPGPTPVPAVQFVAPLPSGAIYGQLKWMPGYGCDAFKPRGTPVYAPADATIKEVIGGQGISGGAELILATAGNVWAWRYRHVQASVKVGQAVKQGDVIGQVYDTSLDQLCAPPVQGYPDRWQHLDLSVNKGTDQFSPLGGGGGNYSAYQWLTEIGYQGTVVAKTPGPTSCGMGLEAAAAMMTPAGRR